MAPMAVHDVHPLKRTSSQAAFDVPTAKKQFTAHRTHHYAKWDVQKAFRKGSFLQERKSAEDLLTRSLDLALEAVGFDAAENSVLEAFRMATEEYMEHFLSQVQQCMLSSRRTHVIPQDFLQSLHMHQLSLRALLPHLNPPLDPKTSQSILEPATEGSVEESGHHDHQSIFAEASHNRSYIPRNFPPLPDKHTYQETPDFPHREENPRAIREKAAEEGRLAEQALRRLVGVENAASYRPQSENKKTPSLRAQRQQMWIDTMAAIADEQKADSQAANGDRMDVDPQQKEEKPDRDLLAELGHLSSRVNSEKKFWRKPARRK